MSVALNNVATADGYTAAAELQAPGSSRVVITVANAAVFYQLGRGRIPRYDEPEQMLVPAIYTLERSCDSIRFRSARAGAPARVIVEAATDGDVR